MKTRFYLLMLLSAGSAFADNCSYMKDSYFVCNAEKQNAKKFLNERHPDLDNNQYHEKIKELSGDLKRCQENFFEECQGRLVTDN